MVVMYYCRCMDERVRVEHRVQRLGRKDEREGLLGESQTKGQGGRWSRVKGKGMYGSSAWAADRGGRFDFWNLGALHGHTQEMFPELCTERVGGIYMTHGG
jgi:hypothetical protein